MPSSSLIFQRILGLREFSLVELADGAKVSVSIIANAVMNKFEPSYTFIP